MADRNIHYEAAFESYLRARGWPYVAVDEAKKSAFAGASLKNFDFIVYSSSGPNLLVDVKGRKFPDTSRAGRRSGRTWENWITREDSEGLAQWQTVFGQGFTGMLVFAYWLQGPPEKSPFQDVHFFAQRHYFFGAVPLNEYVAAAHPRSRKWQTLTMPSGEFSRLVRPVDEFL